MEIFLISDCFVRGLLEASKLQKKLLPFVYGGGGGDLFNDLYREGVPKRGTFFQASSIWKGRDFTSWSIWKDREICHLGR